ncbi:unnamed protein product [Rotaria sordida]|uniref:Alcohol acetyltransferase n=1 Tax=Rotaria sordida TaxID=392033 RepID=A0A818UGD2_9BILA|nr:unnamed protein product [Rotaria sordida]CAF3695352.1 unnamed protein product [Rotaria sordida]
MDHRIISPIEMYSVARNNTHFYKSVVFYLRFKTLSFSLSQWTERIEKCLRLTINAQPRLRLQVDLSRKEPFFIILPINVFDYLPIKIIERTNNYYDHDDQQEEFLDKIIENETNTGFTYNQYSPLWRLIIIFSSNSNIFDIILTLNHAIGDGISGMAFFTTFIECLTEKSTLTFSLNDDRPMNELIPSRLPPFSSLLLKIIEKILLPKFLSQYFFPKTYWTGNIQIIGNDLSKTRLVSFKLSNQLLDLLHKKCQFEKTTIHTAILSSFLLSITEIMGKKNVELSCNTAVNTRRYCQPIESNKKMGVFVSGADSYHYIPYRNNLIDLFWPLARQIKEQINKEIEHSVLPLIQSLKFISNWNQFLIDQRKSLPNGYQNTVDISNILGWSFQSNDPSWNIIHGGFTQSANTVGSLFTLSVVTINDILKVYISFHEHSIENIEQVNFIKDRMKQILIDAIYL